MNNKTIREKIEKITDSHFEMSSFPGARKEAVDNLLALCESIRAEALKEVEGIKPNREEIMGAVARGWCSKANEHKTMDSELALAISREVEKLFTTRQPTLNCNFCNKPMEVLETQCIVGDLTCCGHKNDYPKSLKRKCKQIDHKNYICRACNLLVPKMGVSSNQQSSPKDVTESVLAKLSKGGVQK